MSFISNTWCGAVYPMGILSSTACLNLSWKVVLVTSILTETELQIMSCVIISRMMTAATASTCCHLFIVHTGFGVLSQLETILFLLSFGLSNTLGHEPCARAPMILAPVHFSPCAIRKTTANHCLVTLAPFKPYSCADRSILTILAPKWFNLAPRFDWSLPEKVTLWLSLRRYESSLHQKSNPCAATVRFTSLRRRFWSLRRPNLHHPELWRAITAQIFQSTGFIMG